MASSNALHNWKAIGPEEEEVLELHYVRNNAPSSSVKMQLALELHVSPQNIGRWFSARKRRDIGQARAQRKDAHQIIALAEFFSNNPFPSQQEKEQLARTTGLAYRQVNSWFQNQRKKNGMTNLGNLPSDRLQMWHQTVAHHIRIAEEGRPPAVNPINPNDSPGVALHQVESHGSALGADPSQTHLRFPPGVGQAPQGGGLAILNYPTHVPTPDQNQMRSVKREPSTTPAFTPPSLPTPLPRPPSFYDDSRSDSASGYGTAGTGTLSWGERSRVHDDQLGLGSLRRDDSNSDMWREPVPTRTDNGFSAPSMGFGYPPTTQSYQLDFQSNQPFPQPALSGVLDLRERPNTRGGSVVGGLVGPNPIAAGRSTFRVPDATPVSANGPTLQPSPEERFKNMQLYGSLVAGMAAGMNAGHNPNLQSINPRDKMNRKPSPPLPCSNGQHAQKSANVFAENPNLPLTRPGSAPITTQGHTFEAVTAPQVLHPFTTSQGGFSLSQALPNFAAPDHLRNAIPPVIMTTKPYVSSRDVHSLGDYPGISSIPFNSNGAMGVGMSMGVSGLNLRSGLGIGLGIPGADAMRAGRNRVTRKKAPLSQVEDDYESGDSSGEESASSNVSSLGLNALRIAHLAAVSNVDQAQSGLPARGRAHSTSIHRDPARNFTPVAGGLVGSQLPRLDTSAAVSLPPQLSLTLPTATSPSTYFPDPTASESFRQPQSRSQSLSSDSRADFSRAPIGNTMQFGQRQGYPKQSPNHFQPANTVEWYDSDKYPQTQGQIPAFAPKSSLPDASFLPPRVAPVLGVSPKGASPQPSITTAGYTLFGGSDDNFLPSPLGHTPQQSHDPHWLNYQQQDILAMSNPPHRPQSAPSPPPIAAPQSTAIPGQGSGYQTSPSPPAATTSLYLDRTSRQPVRMSAGQPYRKPSVPDLTSYRAPMNVSMASDAYSDGIHISPDGRTNQHDLSKPQISGADRVARLFETDANSFSNPYYSNLTTTGGPYTAITYFGMDNQNGNTQIPVSQPMPVDGAHDQRGSAGVYSMPGQSQHWMYQGHGGGMVGDRAGQ